jgi:hypothetical protein
MWIYSLLPCQFGPRAAQRRSRAHCTAHRRSTDVDDGLRAGCGKDAVMEAVNSPSAAASGQPCRWRSGPRHRSGTLHALNPRCARRLLIGPEPPSSPSPLESPRGATCRADFIFGACLRSCPPAFQRPPLLIASPHPRCLKVELRFLIEVFARIKAGRKSENAYCGISYPAVRGACDLGPQQWHVHNRPEWLGYTLCRAVSRLWLTGHQQQQRLLALDGGVMVADIATHPSLQDLARLVCMWRQTRRPKQVNGQDTAAESLMGSTECIRGMAIGGL